MAAKALSFDVGDFVVYPKHGVGRVIELQRSEIAGMTLELYVLRFEKERMTLRVPTNKATESGLRALATPEIVSHAMKTLKGKAKVKKAMWSRRAQEYEQKINSGDLIAIAEVVRDLHRADDQREGRPARRVLSQIYEVLVRALFAAQHDGEVVRCAASERRLAPRVVHHVRREVRPGGG